MLQAIGHCLFLFPAIVGFQIRQSTTEGRILLLYADAPMWIESRKRSNASGASQQRYISFAPLAENETNQFKTRFAIDPEQIQQTFARAAPPPARGKS